MRWPPILGSVGFDGGTSPAIALVIPPKRPEAPEPEGACCDEAGDCQITTEFSCVGTYEGDDTVCSPNPCPQPGACCVGGDCTEELESVCAIMTGSFKGEGTECEDGTCVGACCYPGTTCGVMTEEECFILSSGDFYQGDGTSCSPNPCSGACCTGEVCSDGTEGDCGGGTFYGLGTSCVEIDCAYTGACCDDGDCTPDVTYDNCVGVWQGQGSDCDPNLCECDPGPCCYGTTCVYECSDECGGDQAGSCEECAAGACCVGGVCSQVNSFDCADLGGSFVGGDCDPDPC